MNKTHHLVGVALLGLMIACAVAGTGGCKCRKKAPVAVPEKPDRVAPGTSAQVPVPAMPVPRTDAVQTTEAVDPGELDMDLRKLADTLSHVSGELINTEQTLRRENPELKDLFDQAMAAHARYQAKLNEVDEMKTLRSRTDALRREYQRVFDRKKQQMQENE